MRHIVRGIAVVLDACLAVVMAFVIYLSYTVPDSFSVARGETVRLPYPMAMQEQAVMASVGDGHSTELRLLGAVPVKQVEIKVVDRKLVRVSGAPFGIKMFTDGLMVVGMSDVATDGKRINPAREAGVRIGDLVESVDGVQLTSNEQLGGLVERSNGRSLTLVIRRGEERLELTIPPVCSVGDGKYRLGIWVRDSSAGIGTMTYYDPNSGFFTGLGHPVCDVDTGDLMPLQSGEIVSAEITGCKAGKAGSPGELKGRFSGHDRLGALCGNTRTGVYGYLRGDIHLGEEYPVALASEVKTGKAFIMTTVEGNTPEQYEVEIERLDVRQANAAQSMVVRVTDPKLLEITGGIVQGMSGSPIIQNGMLVGSVTHVFVNDPERGFGVFAEDIDANAQALLALQRTAA